MRDVRTEIIAQYVRDDSKRVKEMKSVCMVKNTETMINNAKTLFPRQYRLG